jgi:hypothetical protein
MKYSEPAAEYKAIKGRYFLEDSSFGPPRGLDVVQARQ